MCASFMGHGVALIALVMEAGYPSVRAVWGLDPYKGEP